MKYRAPEYERISFERMLGLTESLLVIASVPSSAAAVERILTEIVKSLRESGVRVIDAFSRPASGNAVLSFGILENSASITESNCLSLIRKCSEEGRRIITWTVMPLRESELLSSWRGSGLVLGTSPSFMREYLLGESGNELLRDGEGILLSGDRYYVVELPSSACRE